MNKQELERRLEKILELMEEELTGEELEQLTDDALLFIELFSVYDKMSTRGKRTTVQTLLNELLIETEVKNANT